MLLSHVIIRSGDAFFDTGSSFYRVPVASPRATTTITNVSLPSHRQAKILYVIDVALDAVVPVGLPQLMQRPGLDLPYPLPCDRESSSNLLQSLGLAIVQTEPHPDDRLLPRVEGADQPLEVVLEHAVLGHGIGILLGIANGVRQGEVPRAAALLAAAGTGRGTLGLGSLDGGFHRHVPSGHLLEKFNLVGLDVDPLGHLRVGRVAAELVLQIPLGPADGVELIVDVNGQPNGSTLIGNGTHDGLLDPPRCVGGEAEAPFGVELLAGPGEAEGALLAQILEVEAAVLVALGDADDEAEVGLREGRLGAEGAADLLLELRHGHPLLNFVGPLGISRWSEARDG